MLQMKDNHLEYDEFADILNVKPYADHGSASKDFEDFLNSRYFLQANSNQKSEDIEAMVETTKRIREQVRCIIMSLRAWHKRHESYKNRTRLRYSYYEGALCYSDLRRHWAYYRHAMKEYAKMTAV